MSTKTKEQTRHDSAKKNQKATPDQGEGQAGNFGSDSDQKKRKGVSPDRSSPNVSKGDMKKG